MTTWNYRVMNVLHPHHEEWLEIRAVYYDDANEPLFYTASAGWICGETMDELRATLRLIEMALDKPILTPMDFPKSETQ